MQRSIEKKSIVPVSPPPLISICIPTYNRKQQLNDLLCCLAKQAESCPEVIDAIEIVISDNCSTDGTQELIYSFNEKLPLQYHRNNANMGAPKNVLEIPTLARGTFCWILGDDDLLYPNALQKILQLIKEHPDVDGFAVGFTYEDDSEKELITGGKSIRTSRHSPIFDDVTLDKKIEKWENSFLWSKHMALYTSLPSIIFRRSKWMEHWASIEKKIGSEPFTCLEGTFPHSCVWAHMFSGKPIYIYSEPLVYFFVGAQEWFSARWPTMAFTFVLELADYMESCGADPKACQTYRRKSFASTFTFRTLLTKPGDYSKKYFSVKRLLRRYGDDNILWDSLRKTLRSIPSRKSRFKLVVEIILAGFLIPKRWKKTSGFAYRESKQFVREVKHRLLPPPVRQLSYSEWQKKKDQQATSFFQNTVPGKPKASLRHPVYLKNPQYLQIGNGFGSGPGLRIEAWDNYRGETYSPSIKIGDRVSFNFNCHIGAIDSVIIGDDVLIGSNVLITDHQHGNPAEPIQGVTWREQPLWSKGPVVIQDNVWIGENVCIMPGVTIGENSVIGANAVVTKDIPRNSIAAGNPARVIRAITESLTEAREGTQREEVLEYGA